MLTKLYLLYYLFILLFLILLEYLNPQLYYIFGLLFFTYALTNLYTNKCSISFS